MTIVIRCDGCAQQITPERSYLQLERPEGVMRWGDELGPWHFHDETCLLRWAEERD